MVCCTIDGDDLLMGRVRISGQVSPSDPQAGALTALSDGLQQGGDMFRCTIDGDYLPVDGPGEDVPAGVYGVAEPSPGWYLQSIDLSDAAPIDGDSQALPLLGELVQSFFSPVLQELVRAGLIHRRCVVLHGPPGSGRRRLVEQQFAGLIAQDAVIVVDGAVDQLLDRVIPALRRRDAYRPIVVVFSDFVQTVQTDGDGVLRLIGNRTAADNVLVIGVAEDMEQLPLSVRLAPLLFAVPMIEPSADDEIRDRTAVAAQQIPQLSADEVALVVKLTAAYPFMVLIKACLMVQDGLLLDALGDWLSDLRTLPPEAYRQRWGDDSSQSLLQEAG